VISPPPITMTSKFVATLLALFCFTLTAKPVQTLNPLVIKYTKFFDSVTGNEVLIKGVDYYPRPNHGDLNKNSLDLFSNLHSNIWERDMVYLKALGVNAIRLYSVNATQNHDEFMCALERHNIYVIVPMAHDCPTCAITRDQAPGCYPPELKQQGMDVIRAFAKYPNTLAFSAGNEVNHYTPLDQPEWNAPCQKKFIADMRSFVASCNTMRQIPVGLVVADSDRLKNAMYYNCNDSVGNYTHRRHRTDPNLTHAEFYGLNSYVACNGTAQIYDEFLGLKALQQDFESYQYSIPVLLTEFGCLSETFPTVKGYEGQRTFLDAKFLAEKKDLRDVFAGSFAFEYSIEYENAHHASPFPFHKFGKQNYGVGYFRPENCDDIAVPCEYEPLPSFDSLMKAYTQSQVVDLVQCMDNYTVPRERQERSNCPPSFLSIFSFEWEADKVPTAECPRQAIFTCLKSAPLMEDETKMGRIASMIGATLLIICGAMIAFRDRRPKFGYDAVAEVEQVSV
jgi:hypothetical protein